MKLQGNPVSPGTAIGEVLIYAPPVLEVRKEIFREGLECEFKEAFYEALKAAEMDMNAVIELLQDEQEEEANIIVAQKELLLDEDMLEMIDSSILSSRKLPEYAIWEAYEEFIELVGKSADSRMAARVSDFVDVRNRLLYKLWGVEQKNLAKLEKPVIIVAHDLLPSDTASLDRKNVLGIITEIGGSTSHSAIIANGYCIPAILGVDSCMQQLSDGIVVGLDAFQGDIHVEPTESICLELRGKMKNHLLQQSQMEKHLRKKCQTSDGDHIQIGLNIASEIPCDEYQYCDFIGLFRTEFLYMNSNHLPTENEQFEAYKKVMTAAEGKPVTLRTLDIGGDKTLPYMDLPNEENPFLGNRALRLCFSYPAIFRTQLRAALRASIFGEMWIMLPMVGRLEDIDRAKAIINDTKQELLNDNIPIGENVKVGVMVEIPSLAVIADMVAAEVDFASIGTNDLCQYLSAVDRMNPKVADYYQNFSPAMVRTLGNIIESFKLSGKPISVCGEMAGDVRGALLLVGLGLKKLSMSGSNMAAVKTALSKIDSEMLKSVANKTKSCRSQTEVLTLLETLVST